MLFTETPCLVNARLKPTPSATEKLPFTIDYKKKLGAGAFGEVYEGTLESDPPAPCAVKIILGYRANRRSEEECKVVKKLKHPNIVHCYYAYQPEENKTILVMERMDLNLTQFLEKEKNSIDFQIHTAVKISSALCYLHGKNIIHRDLSSNNILLNSNALDVKVADFGVSKILHEDLSTLTSLPGTQNYMPPEAFYDKPSYSSSLDIFSLGVLLIQMITGLHPDPSERLRVINERTFEKVEECLRRKAHIDKIPLDHPLHDLALQCIQDDQTKRPTAEVVILQLETKRTVRALEQQSKIAKLQQALQEQKQELDSLKDEIALLTYENEEREQREKCIRVWKQNTIEVIKDSFDQL